MPFENQLPELLDTELRLAARFGVKPLKIGEAGFDEVIDRGTIKWAVSENGELLVIPKYVNEREMPHTILTGGKPVLAAGEAEICGSEDEYFMLEINNYSGHFIPSRNSLDIGKEAFRQEGIEPTTALTIYY